MFTDAKSEIARRREIFLPQLVFLNLEASLQDFLRFGPANCHVDGDFLVTSYAECADGEAGFAWKEG